MTPQEFIASRRNVGLKGRSASHSHFNDLCQLLGVDDPIGVGPQCEWFAFEKGASKTSGLEGGADIIRSSRVHAAKETALHGELVE